MQIALIGKVGGFYIGECSKCDDEVELVITEDDLICIECGSHEPHYTDQDTQGDTPDSVGAPPWRVVPIVTVT